MINRILTLERRTRTHAADPDAWCDLAEARLEEGQRVEALAAAESAAQSRVESAAQWVRIGDLFRALDLRDHARQMYLDACEFDRSSALAHLRLGQMLLAEGEAEDAANLFATAVWLAPDDGAARIGQAQALIALRSYDEAREHLMEVIEDTPEVIEAWGLLADLHLRRGQAAEAFAALRKGFSLRNTDRALGLRLGRLLREAGFARDAAITLATVARHHPDEETLLELAEAQRDAGERAGSAATLQRAADEGSARAVAQLGAVLRQEERYAEAIPLLRRAVAATPTDAELYVQLGGALMATGEFGAAAAILAKGVMNAADDRRLRLMLAEANAAYAGEPDESITPEESVEMDMVARASSGLQAGDMAFSGNLKQFAVVDLLEFLRLNQRTGVLRLISEGRVGEIHLSGGRLAGATTSQSTRLGDLLVKSNLLTPAGLEKSIRLQQGFGRPVPLARILLDNDIVERDALRPVLEEQVQTAIGHIMQWQDGHFAFESDDSGATPGRLILLDTGMVMLEALRLQDEEKHTAGGQ
ncbi:MAG: tetratricopeptide repeat protein [Myxococcales bacterium]|nr:tetratricopeptide repeat protein [Myxococcales bacterium]